MAGTKNTAARNLLADSIGDSLDSGTLKIYTTGQATLLATFNLPVAAFAAASVGVITLSGVPISATAAAAGTAAEAVLSNSGDTIQVSGLTVGTSATDVIIDNAVIASGQTVNLNAFTWTEPALTA
tara:strand:- start:6086 stop:6463 length:378 start_codon:yes stop_codon:yes gene_type:complete